jgi:hypothetical protein
MTSAADFDLESFYAYAFRGKAMMAVRAPFATTGDAPDLIGRTARIGGALYEIVALSRQISGPIAKGEPIGVEVRSLAGGEPAQ